MSRRQNFPFLSSRDLVGLEFSRLQDSVSGFRGNSSILEATRQFQASITDFRGNNGILEVTRQLQAFVSDFRGNSGILEATRQLQAFVSDFKGNSGILEATRQLQAFKGNSGLLEATRQLQAFKGSGILEATRQLQAYGSDFRGNSGILEATRQLQASVSAFRDNSGILEATRQLQASMRGLSPTGQLGTINVANGLLGPTAALRALGGLADGSFQHTSFAGLFGGLGRIAEIDVEAEQAELEQLLFDLPTWSELAARLAAFLKTHHVALVLFLLAVVHAQVLFSLSQKSSDIQAEEATQRDSTHAKELREHDQETAERMEEFASQLEGAVERLAVLQQSLAASAAENPDGETVETNLVEQRLVHRTTRVHTHPRRNSAVVARVPRQERVFVFEHRSKWLYVGYSDVVAGRPITGWVRKKYTRPSGSPGEVLFSRGK